ncbi:helix-turn-helix domain-containing protein [Nocardia sp. NPDC058058]|uniref:helix-turn-helix domain-containing protein n=1 Tax=Nocardia sp. NPDC058058 TaxID=3346317 RepID=UPI0036DD8BB9
MPLITGTTSTRLAGLIRTTAINAGVSVPDLNAICPSVDPAVLADDLLRVPTEWAWRAWELIDATAGPGSGLLATAAAKHGGLHVWDYLFTSAPTLAESVRIAIGLRGVVTDPGVGWVVEEDGRLLTIRETAAIEPDGVLPPIEEFMLSIMLRRVREATRQQVVPVRVAFSHNATHRYRHLVDEFGTGRIDFGAAHAAITFLDASELPTGDDPHLGAMVRHYAELLLATSRPAPDWRKTLHDTVIAALRDGDTSLDAAARRLLMSPRTLQRRLCEHDTTWRREIETVRHEHAIQLMRHTDLPVQSVAARLGYTDARTLRRAIRRWSGQGAEEFRRGLRDAAAPRAAALAG